MISGAGQDAHTKNAGKSESQKRLKEGQPCKHDWETKKYKDMDNRTCYYKRCRKCGDVIDDDYIVY